MWLLSCCNKHTCYNLGKPWPKTKNWSCSRLLVAQMSEGKLEQLYKKDLVGTQSHVPDVQHIIYRQVHIRIGREQCNNW